MPVRVASSDFTVAAGATDVVVESKIANLAQLIPTKGVAIPMAMKFVPTSPDVTITKLIIQSDVNPEVAYQVYNGAAIGLDVLNDMLKGEVAAGVAITPIGFDVDHGLKAVMTLSNAGAGDFSGKIIWRLHNQIPKFAESLIKTYATPHVPERVKRIDPMGKFGPAKYEDIAKDVVPSPEITI